MQPEARIRQGQGIDHQPWAEVGTADADADDIGDIAGIQFSDQFAHPRLRGHGLRARPACDRRSRIVAAQCRMQHGTAFGGIDGLAVELASHRRRQIGLPGDGEQGVQGFAVVALAGEARVQRAEPQREIARAGRIGFHQAGDRAAGQALRMRVEAGEQAHAACFGIEWLVWVRRLSRSTYTQVGLYVAASASSHWP